MRLGYMLNRVDVVNSFFDIDVFKCCMKAWRERINKSTPQQEHNDCDFHLCFVTIDL